jgi:peptidylprolyl isomerase
MAALAKRLTITNMSDFMSHAKEGDTVKTHYTGKLDDGTEFDSSAGGEPLEFVLGSGQVIPGFESAVEGMAVGDSKTVRIEADNAYGPRHDQLVQEVPRSALPEELTPEEGMTLQSTTPDGQVAMLKVTEVSEETITVDANHPLAGEALNFEIELVAIA